MQSNEHKMKTIQVCAWFCSRSIATGFSRIPLFLLFLLMIQSASSNISSKSLNKTIYSNSKAVSHLTTVRFHRRFRRHIQWFLCGNHLPGASFHMRTRQYPIKKYKSNSPSHVDKQNVTNVIDLSSIYQSVPFGNFTE